MNYIKHLTAFFDKIIPDNSLNPTHVSLYIALFQSWNVNRFINPISITRDEMMRISKICSKATYHKCMKELHEKQYLIYKPSFNPYKGSMVVLLDFSESQKPVQKTNSTPRKNVPVLEQVLYKKQTTTRTASEQALVPSINNTNITNNSNFENEENTQQRKNKIEMQFNFDVPKKLESATQSYKTQNVKKEKSAAKKEKNKDGSWRTPSRVLYKDEHPNSEEIKNYFQENHFPEIEAQKFFNYFASNGWLVGGKTPMVNWQAAAQNWILNRTNFNSNPDQPNRAKHLNTATEKNYAEPL